MELSIIVNENDEIIEYKDRSTVDENDIYRISALVIKNSDGEFLLAQRSFNKKLGPGVWSFSAAGWVEKGESYDEAIAKEASEEIGVNDIEMTRIFKKRASAVGEFFCQFYIANLDVGLEYFTIQEEEVERLRWFSVDEIKKREFEGNAFSENLLKNLDELIAL